MLNEILSAVILFVFTGLLVVGAVSTAGRALRYRRFKFKQPVLLNRDRDMLIGLALPFVLVGVVRAFSLQMYAFDSTGVPHLWWLLVTGLPPIYALARYDYFELFRIERTPRDTTRAETLIEKEDREVGDTRRSKQARNGTAPKP